MDSTIEELRKAFSLEKEPKNDTLEKEKLLMKDVINVTCAYKNISAVQGYDPDKVIRFLNKPIPEIRTSLQYDNMDEVELRKLVYSLIPKVKKFGNFMT